MFGRKSYRKKTDQKPVFSGCSASASSGRQPLKIAPSPLIFEYGLYEDLRAKVPILDACFGKIIRLTTDFRLTAPTKAAQKVLDEFSRSVSLGVSGKSINSFADLYLDTLLTYGKAMGEVLIDAKRRRISAISVPDPTLFRITAGGGYGEMRIADLCSNEPIRLADPERVFYTTLNPSVRDPEGVPILRGIPAFANVLMRIYECIGQNFDRVGNVRYAVTYRPSSDPSDKALAKERAMEIARQWSEGMKNSGSGEVSDFVAVGDVDIKVIGADNQVLDTEIPVRQLLEQMISKLSIPPFLLGLNWSSTERMSSQQADILTSELEYYRRLLTPALVQIGNAALRLAGYDCGCEVEWANINLQDEEALAAARLSNARAMEIEKRLAV